MKTIPVLINFDYTKQIGTMTIDETRLPKNTGFHFAIGYKTGTPDANGADEDYELFAVSATPSHLFKP